MQTVKNLALAAIAAISVAALPSFAQTGGNTGGNAAGNTRIDQRQANQERRIEQGEKSGALTKREARRLERGQEHVQRMENKAAADGNVSKKEARRIERAQDRQSREIYREKHDRQRRK
jgi:hypothetical protein